MAHLTDFTVAELAAKLTNRECSVREVANAFSERIQTTESLLGSFLTLAESGAVNDQIDAAQSKIDSGSASPMTGIPIGVKDNISTEGLRTTCASQILDNYIPPFNATCVDRLNEAGAIVLGKTNLDEFAFGASTETSSYQSTKNPWDTSRSPGGSSGGSAACVSARQTPVSLGSDTGGSIRQPAALCGVVGFKPTYGRVSRYGLVAFGSSLDQIGPFAQTVEDAAILAEAISGHDDRDATSLPQPPISSRDVKSGSLKGKRIALPKELFTDAAQPGVIDQIQRTIDALTAEGVEFAEVSIPEIKLGVTTYYIIGPAEASSNLARFDGVRFGPREDGEGHVGAVASTRGRRFGKEVKTRIVVGTYVLSAGYYDAFYLRAQQVRGKMAAEFERVFGEFDAVLSPTSPCVAFKIGELIDDPMALKLVDLCTIPANMGGFPAISLPCGLSDGLPVGVQLMGGVNQDESLLQLAHSVERALDCKLRAPIA